VEVVFGSGNYNYLCNQYLPALTLWVRIPLSVTSWRSVSLVEEIGVPSETTNLPHVTYKLYNIMFYRVHLAWAGFELTKLVLVGTDCINWNIVESGVKHYNHNTHPFNYVFNLDLSIRIPHNNMAEILLNKVIKIS
jgi:hypothetical protein